MPWYFPGPRNTSAITIVVPTTLIMCEERAGKANFLDFITSVDSHRTKSESDVLRREVHLEVRVCTKRRHSLESLKESTPGEEPSDSRRPATHHRKLY